MEKKKKTRGGGACDVVTDLSEDVQVCLPSSVLAVGEEANEVNSSGQSVAAHRTICALLFLVFVSLSMVGKWTQLWYTELCHTHDYTLCARTYHDE